jgi:hypothetical protein
MAIKRSEDLGLQNTQAGDHLELTPDNCGTFNTSWCDNILPVRREPRKSHRLHRKTTRYLRQHRVDRCEWHVHSIAATGGLGLHWSAASPETSTRQPRNWPHRIVDLQDEGSEVRTAVTMSISSTLCEAQPVDFQYP